MATNEPKPFDPDAYMNPNVAPNPVGTTQPQQQSMMGGNRETQPPASSRRPAPCGQPAPSVAQRRAVSKPLASTDPVILAPADADHLAHFKKPRACPVAHVLA